MNALSLRGAAATKQSLNVIPAKAQDPKPYSKIVILRKGGGSKAIDLALWIVRTSRLPAGRQGQ